MCQICECQKYIAQGGEKVRDRAIEIIQRLGVTPGNAPLFEDGESICGLIGPKMSPGHGNDEVWDIVLWLSQAHAHLNEGRNSAAAAAAREVFRRFPAKTNPKETLVLWHQLEQLEREVRSEELLSTLEPRIQAALEAVRRVHDNSRERIRQLAQQYGLSS